jgi:hypothetical protein
MLLRIGNKVFFLGEVKFHRSMRLHKFSKPSFGHISANFHRIELKLMPTLEITKVMGKNISPCVPITIKGFRGLEKNGLRFL